MKTNKKHTRRELVSNLLLGGAGLSTLPLWLELLRSESAQAQSGASPKRLLTVFLRGGWDSLLGSDPVIGSKTTSNSFEAVYKTLATTTVPGKSNLILGPGLAPAASAFQRLPTAFINGLFTEITAHELATAYMFSGVMSLSRSREYPALAALAGQSAGVFPAHLVLGGPIPLGDTKDASPPLQSQTPGVLADMLLGAYSTDLKPESISLAHQLLAKRDSQYKENLSPTGQSRFSSWVNSGANIQSLYQQNFGSKVKITDAVKARYGFTEDWKNKGMMAGAFLTLSSGISPFVTVSLDGFDTHTNHLGIHQPLLQEFANALNVLVTDLQNTRDPSDPTKWLSQTTTILITSEFVRTPKFNPAAGADHWASGAAILMGQGVIDNTLVGRTGLDALPRGWVNGSDAPIDSTNKLLPEHLVASVLRYLGFTSAADRISAKKIDGVLS
jgi:hypothetical protein